MSLDAHQGPVPSSRAWTRVARATSTCPGLLARRQLHQPSDWKGRRVLFGDGTTAAVYRETVRDPWPRSDPAALVVGFRLRHVTGDLGHATFRAESLLNTALFVGFDGFTSKLWLRHDESGTYRGLYEWEGAERATEYARSLWRVLALVSEPSSIRYVVVPGVRRDELVLGRAEPTGATGAVDSEWWRPIGTDQPTS
jgi:hypothetical protein